MLEQIKCKVCGEYADVQIGTEQYHERLCYSCEDDLTQKEELK